MGETCSTLGEISNTYKILVRNPQGKKPLGKPRHRRENNVKFNLTEGGCEDVNWVKLAQGKVQWQAAVKTVVKLRVP